VRSSVELWPSQRLVTVKAYLPRWDVESEEGEAEQD